MTEAQKLIDSIEQDLQRMRIDEALKASLVARLDHLRGMYERNGSEVSRFGVLRP